MSIHVDSEYKLFILFSRTLILVACITWMFLLENLISFRDIELNE